MEMVNSTDVKSTNVLSWLKTPGELNIVQISVMSSVIILMLKTVAQWLGDVHKSKKKP
jgi:hypothetical protein